MRLTREKHRELTERQGGLNEALLAEDELGIVVRAHIYIEQELIEFIKARLSPPEALDALALDYSGRLKLALALGLPKDFKPALTFVGTLRNKFAHRLGTKITKLEADDFQKALGKHHVIATDSYDRTRKKVGDGPKATPLGKRSPLDRCIIYFVTLWGGVAVVAAKAKEIEA